MALNNLGLGFVFTARDLASGAISNLERSFMSLDRRVGLGAERIQSSVQQLGVGLAVFTAGAATVGGAFSLANAAGNDAGTALFLITGRLAIGSVVFAVFLGLVSGLYPSLHAARLHPVAALRYE